MCLIHMEVVLSFHQTSPGLVALCNLVAVPLLEHPISDHFVSVWMSPLEERKKKKLINSPGLKKW